LQSAEIARKFGMIFPVRENLSSSSGGSLVHRQWDFILPILQGHYQVILYDQRGAGLSDRTSSGITVEKWVDDLGFILDEIGVRKTHVFAMSNGSLMAICFVAIYPGIVGAIIHYGIYKFAKREASSVKKSATRVTFNRPSCKPACNVFPEERYSRAKKSQAIQGIYMGYD
jgi:hypothetical protein